MFKKFADSVKGSFLRGAQFVKKGIENAPKFIKQAQNVSKQIADTATKAADVATKVKGIADKHNLIPNSLKGKVNKGFKTGIDAAADINKANDKFGAVSNDVLGALN